MQTWQGSLGKKFTVGGGVVHACVLCALSTQPVEMTSQERRREQHMEIIWNLQKMDFRGCERVAEISLKGILK